MMKTDVGHTLDLLVAGIVLLLLFVATYSQRRTWITLGSTALSIVLIAGCVFFLTAQGSSQTDQGLAQLAKTLPAGWDQPALKFTAAMEQVASSLARARKRAAERAAAREPQPVLTASITRWFSWGAKSGADAEAEPDPAPPAPAEAEAAPTDIEATPADLEAAPHVPIKWFLDAPTRTASEAFLLSGANVSDQPLENVQAVLKPDSGVGELALVLEVEGRDGGAVIPPGARFSLATDRLTKDGAKQLSGAILSFAYVQAGRRKSSIMYLTPPMLTQAEND